MNDCSALRRGRCRTEERRWLLLLCAGICGASRTKSSANMSPRRRRALSSAATHPCCFAPLFKRYALLARVIAAAAGVFATIQWQRERRHAQSAGSVRLCALCPAANSAILTHAAVIRLRAAMASSRRYMRSTVQTALQEPFIAMPRWQSSFYNIQRTCCPPSGTRFAKRCDGVRYMVTL